MGEDDGDRRDLLTSSATSMVPGIGSTTLPTIHVLIRVKSRS